MPGSRLRLTNAVAAGIALLAAWAGSSPLAARPVTLDDLMRRERFGAVQLDPSERWLVVERRGPYAEAARFDLETFNEIARTTLARMDLRDPGRLEPLFAASQGVGYAAGAFSPDGRRMAVFRLTDRRWQLGVVTLVTRRVRWLEVTPEKPPFGKPLQWLSNTELVVIARPADDLPFLLRWRRNAALLLPGRWRVTARGFGAATAIGSGHYRNVRPQPAQDRLLRVDVLSGRTRKLAAGPFVDLEVSHDGRHVALIESDGDIPMSAGHVVQGEYGLERLRHRVRLLDLASGALTSPCGGCDVMMSPIAWSHTSGDLLIFARRDGEAWPGGFLYCLNARTRAVTRIKSGDIVPQVSLRPEAVQAAWFAGEPIVWGAAPGGPHPNWYRLTAAGPVSLTDGLPAPSGDALTLSDTALLLAVDGQAWRIDPDGQRKRVAEDFEMPTTSLDGGSGREAYSGPLGRPLIGVRAGRAVLVSDTGVRESGLLPRGAEILAYSARANGVLVRTWPAGGEERLQWIPQTGAARTIATINRHLADVTPPVLRAIRHEGRNGEQLTSWLLLPEGVTAAGHPPPLVVWPYPGLEYRAPPAIANLKAPDLTEAPQLLAAHGFAVLLPALPAPAEGAEPAARLADDVLAIVDAATLDPTLRGAFDPERIGVWGQSFGGYAALVMLTQTSRFRAAIADASMSDLFSLWGEVQPGLRVDPSEGLNLGFSAGWTEDLQGAMRAPPWADPQRYLRNSPVFHADRITTPLLLVHGDQDTFPLGQAEEMFSSLLRQDKDAVLVTYWGEGHVVRSPGNLRDLYVRGFAWLDRYLLSDPVSATADPPAASLGPDPANAVPKTRSPLR
jgi:dipeptidyl aminopeptidase/acylaminoacyl peptidase